MTIKQAAKLLQVDPNTLYRWARAGRFPAGKIGKEWRVLHSDAIAFIEKNKHRNEFLTNDQTAELITALIGRREIPLKFQYLGEGADKFITLEYTNEYAIGQQELDLIVENDHLIMSKLGHFNFNVLDMGCGDGNKAATVVTRLASDSIPHYFPIDISARMIDAAIQTMQTVHSNANIESFNEDFEQGNLAKITYYLRRRYQRNNLVLFLGQTIGNLFDYHRVLVNLREAMTEDDYLLVGLAMLSKWTDPTKAYENELLYDLLFTLPEKIGIKKIHANVKVYFNQEKNQVEWKLEFKKDWTKQLSQDLLHFNKGQKVLLGISRRFTKEEIFEMFAKAGFRMELFLPTKEKDYGLVLCRPHSWERKT